MKGKAFEKVKEKHKKVIFFRFEIRHLHISSSSGLVLYTIGLIHFFLQNATHRHDRAHTHSFHSQKFAQARIFGMLLP